jgi:hypothetical protein
MEQDPTMQTIPGIFGSPAAYITILPPALGVTVDYWIGPAAPYDPPVDPPTPPGYFWVPLPMQSDYPNFGCTYSDWMWFDSTSNQLQYGKTITVTGSGDAYQADGADFWWYYAVL